MLNAAAAFPKLGGGCTMAAEAESADVLQVAFAATLADRKDVVGVPEAFTVQAAHAPVLQQRVTARAARPAKLAQGGQRVDATSGAEAAVPREDLIAEVGGLRAQLPLMHAVVGAEGESASRHLERAPAAQATAVRTARDGAAIHPASGHNADGAHLLLFVHGGGCRRVVHFSCTHQSRNSYRHPFAYHSASQKVFRKNFVSTRKRWSTGVSLLTRGTAPETDSTAMPKALLVFAHPDDETIALGARMGRFGGAHFVHVTDGAPRDERDSRAHGFATLDDYRKARRAEFLQVLERAGIPQASTECLGVPDQRASLHLARLAIEICKRLEQFEPEIVFTHPYEGGHPDHDACAFAVHHGVAMRKGHRPRTPTIVEAAFYHRGARGMTTGTFLQGPERKEEVAYSLSQPERDRKQTLIECFATQKQVLTQFRLETERFRVAPSYDFGQPPHPPPVLYDEHPWGMTSERFCRLAREAQHMLHRGEA